MPDDQDASGLEGQTLGKKFLVQRLIGEGGMGAVYEVEHVVTKRRGALKILHRSFATASDIAERFLLEASAAGRIGNPHIVETLDAGELPSGEPYIFMELLAGRPVRQLLLERGTLPFGEAREIVLQVADGLAAAHAVGIVHRDIKPDNLFVCSGAVPFVKILDFGISKFAEPYLVKRLTEQGATLGTPHYMSPEQVVSKRDIDGRVDVYALGVVLYECITGRVPFDADSLPALSVKIFEGKYTRASELMTAAPAGLDALLARALAREPSARFASVLELKEALDDLLVPSSRPATLVSRPTAAYGPVSSSIKTEVMHGLNDRTAGNERPLITPPPAPARSTAPGVTPSGRAPERERARPRVFVISALTLLGLGGGAAALKSAASSVTTDTSPSQDRASIPDAPSTAQRPEAPRLESESAHPASSLGITVTSASVAPGPGRERRMRPAPSSSSSQRGPRSQAAADGLSERNPFAD